MRKTARIRRLKELSYMLKNHDKLFKEVAFSISCWHTRQEGVGCGVLFGRNKDKQKSYSCGTAACALGSAALHKPFIKAGLSFDICNSPSYKGERDFYAGSCFFGIGYDASINLFANSSYKNPPTAAKVARRVDSLIKKYEAAA